uniref:Putative sigma-70 region domain containing protein n=1 Tax=viral metagenome TaxID=1070528 RepID=A0A6H1ZXY4_9ZZZZ
MIIFKDDDLKALCLLGKRVALKQLRAKILVDDSLQSDVESRVNEVLAKAINYFKNKEQRDFESYYIMKIYWMVGDIVRETLGRGTKRRIMFQSQHMPLSDYNEYSRLDRNINFVDIIDKAIDKNRIFASLPTAQRRVLSLLGEGYGGTEIGQIMGLCRQRISQIKQEAIKNARSIYDETNKPTEIEHKKNPPYNHK